MEQQDLLVRFNELLDNYRKHRDYIRRVAAQSEKFSSAVIERVRLDHEVKSSEVAEGILPLVGEMTAAIGIIQGRLGEINDGKSDSDVELEELNLRLAIGEIDDDEFASLSEGLRSVLDDAEGEISGLREGLDGLQGALDSWVELAAEAGQETGVDPSASPAEDAPAEDDGDAAEAVEVEIEDDSSDDDDDDAAGDDSDVAADGDESDNSDGEAEADEGESSEAGDSSDDEVSFDADESEGDVELDLVGGADGGVGGDEIAIDLEPAGAKEEGEGAEDDADDAGEGGESRRALLLYQEGTPEEQIYPFTNDVLTVGRGRDNDIQIKNDSKVSRFHCKLYRRNGNYYIEDNRSSNGTLVNSELITERRLFGGEEVIIGETFFRFRLM